MGLFGKKKEEQKKDAPKEAVKKPVTKSAVKKDVPKKETEQKDATTKKQASDHATRKHSSKPILMRALITEKVTDLNEKNQYVFAVHPNVNKIEVKKEIKRTYNVDPVKVNMISVDGKKVRFGRTFGKQKDWKKAIVVLKKGDSIAVGKDAK